MAELKALLATMLTSRLGPTHRIRAVEHRSSSARSSFLLEEVDVIVDEGELIRLVLKVLGSPGLQASAGMAKPLFLHDPLREIELYRFLARADLSGARDSALALPRSARRAYGNARISH